MIKILSKQKKINVLTKEELNNIVSGTAPDCEEGFFFSLSYGRCVRGNLVDGTPLDICEAR